MPEPAYLRTSVFTIAVANDDFSDFQIKLSSAKNKIEIPERVEVAKEMSVVYNLIVIFFIKNFGSTKGIFDPLAE